VTTILGDPALRAKWEKELAGMRDRILDMRKAFVRGLKSAGANRDFSFITEQKGMFSFSGLDKDQVERLKSEFGIYIVGSGRINVAGMTDSNMKALCEAIVSVL
jgi:aromatic-amino-acid transaminase